MRILLVDDHPLMLEIMRAVLMKEFDDAEVQCATDLAEAFAHARVAGAPELVVLDLGLPGCTGIDALTRFRKAFPDIPVVVLSANDDAHVVNAALKAGARGYLLKSYSRKLMQAALRLVVAGGVYIPPEALLAYEPDLGLSERQLEVLRHIVKGLPNAKIAKALDISRNTVKQHVRAVFAALRVSSGTEALIAASRLGFKYDH